MLACEILRGMDKFRRRNKAKQTDTIWISLKFRRGNPLPHTSTSPTPPNRNPNLLVVSEKLRFMWMENSSKIYWIENLLLKTEIREEFFFFCKNIKEKTLIKKQKPTFCAFHWHCFLWNCISYFPLKSF